MTEKNKTNFRVDRVKKLGELYSDDASARRRYNRTPSRSTTSYTTAAEVREALSQALTDREQVVTASEQLFATNPIYAGVINYLANMFMWRYKVTPHKVYTKSKAKARKQIKEEDFRVIYELMLEVVDGLSIETKFPAMLSALFINGGVYFTTYCDEESLTIDTLLLPDKYCRKIGETQYGTALIQFDFSYFDSLSLNDDQLKEYLDGFSKEFQKKYGIYKSKGNDYRWQDLDPHFSSGILLNDASIPTYFYILGGILDYEKYQDNELERNENLLKYLVVQTMPIYQDRLIFEVDEVNALHKSLRKIIDKGEKTRLITTFGDVKLLKVAENDTSENQVLSKAFTAIFNNAGFNSGIFTSESVEALKMSLVRDKGMVWKYVQALLNFYTIALNNWFEFKSYQADIDILPISSYTYNDDIRIYKENATLGVGKLDYIIATGIKQQNISDQFALESYLKLDQIVPMQTSYTQTAEDRSGEGDSGNKDDSSDDMPDPRIEPLDEDSSQNDDSSTDED